MPQPNHDTRETANFEDIKFLLGPYDYSQRQIDKLEEIYSKYEIDYNNSELIIEEYGQHEFIYNNHY